MSDNDIGSLIYALLLGMVLLSYLLVAHRGRMGEMVRNAALWALIFIGTALVMSVWPQIQRQLIPQQFVSTETGRIEAPRGEDGHYYLTMEFDGVPVEFVVDTGATDVVLNLEDAARIGIDVDNLIYSGRAFTANGEVRIARAWIENASVGGYNEGTLRVSVNEGDLGISLLGMSYLERFGRISIEAEKMIFER